MKFYLCKKRGGGRTSFGHAEGAGHNKFWGIVLTGELEVLAILKGGGAQKFRTRDCPIV